MSAYTWKAAAFLVFKKSLKAQTQEWCKRCPRGIILESSLIVTYCLNRGDCRAVSQPWVCENGLLPLCDCCWTVVLKCLKSCDSAEQFPCVLAVTANTVLCSALGLVLHTAIFPTLSHGNISSDRNQHNGSCVVWDLPFHTVRIQKWGEVCASEGDRKQGRL